MKPWEHVLTAIDRQLSVMVSRARPGRMLVPIVYAPAAMFQKPVSNYPRPSQGKYEL